MFYCLVLFVFASVFFFYVLLLFLCSFLILFFYFVVVFDFSFSIVPHCVLYHKYFVKSVVCICIKYSGVCACVCVAACVSFRACFWVRRSGPVIVLPSG